VCGNQGKTLEMSVECMELGLLRSPNSLKWGWRDQNLCKIIDL